MYVQNVYVLELYSEKCEIIYIFRPWLVMHVRLYDPSKICAIHHNYKNVVFVFLFVFFNLFEISNVVCLIT